jgi:hypothetical protein
MNEPLNVAGVPAVACSDLLGVMVSILFVAVSLALLVRGWSAKRLRQRTIAVLVLALAVNVLHLVDLGREARGEKSMRQILWHMLSPQRKMTSEQNGSLPDSLTMPRNVSGSLSNQPASETLPPLSGESHPQPNP